MADVDQGSIVGGISALIVALGGSAVAVREYFKRSKLTDVNIDSAISGVAANDGVIKNLQEENARLKTDMETMRRQLQSEIDALRKDLDEVIRKLANVRLVALDAYQLATDCDCDHRDRLLEHLKQIIKDA